MEDEEEFGQLLRYVLPQLVENLSQHTNLEDYQKNIESNEGLLNRRLRLEMPDCESKIIQLFLRNDEEVLIINEKEIYAFTIKNSSDIRKSLVSLIAVLMCSQENVRFQSNCPILMDFIEAMTARFANVIRYHFVDLLSRAFDLLNDKRFSFNYEKLTESDLPEEFLGEFTDPCLEIEQRKTWKGKRPIKPYRIDQLSKYSISYERMQELLPQDIAQPMETDEPPKTPSKWSDPHIYVYDTVIDYEMPFMRRPNSKKFTEERQFIRQTAQKYKTALKEYYPKLLRRGQKPTFVANVYEIDDCVNVIMQTNEVVKHYQLVINSSTQMRRLAITVYLVMISSEKNSKIAFRICNSQFVELIRAYMWKADKYHWQKEQNDAVIEIQDILLNIMGNQRQRTVDYILGENNGLGNEGEVMKFRDAVLINGEKLENYGSSQDHQGIEARKSKKDGLQEPVQKADGENDGDITEYQQAYNCYSANITQMK